MEALCLFFKLKSFLAFLPIQWQKLINRHIQVKRSDGISDKKRSDTFKYPRGVFGLKLCGGFEMEEKPKTKKVWKGKSGSNLMSRPDFLKATGMAAAGAGMATIGMSKTVKAQAPLDPDDHAHRIATLAAFVDTVMPTMNVGVNIPLKDLDLSTGNLIDLDDSSGPVVMNNFGSPETGTKGAVDFPKSYLMMYYYQIPRVSGLVKEFVVDLFVEVLDGLAAPFTPPGYPDPPIRYKDLPYDIRYQIFYWLGSDDSILTALMHGVNPPEQLIKDAINAYDARSLAAVMFVFCIKTYYGPDINIEPYGYSLVNGEFPLYKYERNSDYTWNLIPDSPWTQVGYSGPTYKNSDYACKYDGLRVTIADGKVKIQ